MIRRSMLRSGVLVAMLPALAGCGDGAAPSPQPTQPAARAQAAPAAATPRVEPLAPDPSAREQAVAAWLKRTFPLSDAAAIYTRSVQDRIARARACPDEACRRAAAAERRAAVALAEGGSASLPGFPASSGAFARSEPGYTGPVRLIPLDPSSALLAASLSFKGRLVCGLTARLTRSAGDGWNATAIAPEGEPLTVAFGSGRAFALAYADPAHQPWNDSYCSTGTNIDGRYAARD